ncbi:MAG TPA: nuclear transport factor 2 family protein [Microvirga sp.]|nr:nuclear transport factor 2 family protein [Microvirga sp.]
MDTVPPIVRRYLDAYNVRDVDGLVACLTEDVVFENVSGGTVNVRTTDRAAFESLARQSVHLFSEREQVATNCIAEGDRIAIKVRYRAVVAADMPNGWKAGQILDLQGVSFFKLAGGRIAEIADVS